MRILYFLAHPEIIGGAVKQMLVHSRIMNEIGHNVKVIIQCDSNGHYIDHYDDLCKTYGLDYDSAFYEVSTCIEEIDIISAVELYSNLENIITCYNPDIIHSLQLNPTVELVARKRNIPHIMSIYPAAIDMFNINWSNVFPRYLIGDSEYYCKRWSDRLDIKSFCIRVAYEPQRDTPCRQIRDDLHSNHLERSAVYRLINIAHVSEHKNQLEIFRFIFLCRKSGINVKLVVLGEAENKYSDLCRAYIRENNLDECVDILGFVENVDDYLMDSDLLVHASLVESFPGAIVEAMGNHLPVMVTAVGGIPELIKNGVNGFVVDGFSGEKIYEAFLQYVDYVESGKINNIIESAYETYLSNDSYSIVGNKLIGCYESVILDEKNKDVYDLKQASNKFCLDISDYYLELKSRNYSDYTLKHSYYLYHLRNKCRTKKRALVWGTGRMSTIGKEWCEILNLEICGFIDNAKCGTYLNYNIYKPHDMMVKEIDYIIVSVADFLFVQEIIQELDKLGKKRNEDYFLICNNPCYLC
jgi:glycosyltransferase involved in cell wall biosynthesis